MRIEVNGQLQDRPNGMNVAELLAGLSLEPRRVAVELNEQIVPRANYAQTRLNDDDKVEIVTFVGGG